MWEGAIALEYKLEELESQIRELKKYIVFDVGRLLKAFMIKSCCMPWDGTIAIICLAFSSKLEMGISPI